MSEDALRPKSDVQSSPEAALGSTERSVRFVECEQCLPLCFDNAGQASDVHTFVLHGADCHWKVAVTGDKTIGMSIVALMRLALDIQTAGARQSNLEHETTGPSWPRPAQEGLGGDCPRGIQRRGADAIADDGRTRVVRAGEWLASHHESAIRPARRGTRSSCRYARRASPFWRDLQCLRRAVDSGHQAGAQHGSESQANGVAA
jgi:hypothetical protein